MSTNFRLSSFYNFFLINSQRRNFQVNNWYLQEMRPLRTRGLIEKLVRVGEGIVVVGRAAAALSGGREMGVVQDLAGGRRQAHFGQLRQIVELVGAFARALR